MKIPPVHWWLDERNGAAAPYFGLSQIAAAQGRWPKVMSWQLLSERQGVQSLDPRHPQHFCDGCNTGADQPEAVALQGPHAIRDGHGPQFVGSPVPLDFRSQ